jgi:hypothetical protein
VISGVYLYSDPDHEPSIAMQRNVRALRHLCELLKFSSFSIATTSASGSRLIPAETMLSHGSLSSMHDSSFWTKFLVSPNCDSINRLILLVLGYQQQAHWRPIQKFTREMLNSLFCQDESALLAEIATERASLLKDLTQAQSDQLTAENAARATEQALRQLTAEHHAILSQLNLKDNTELNDIVQQFRGLNDDIEKASLRIAMIVPAGSVKQHSNWLEARSTIGLQQFLGESHGPLLILNAPDGRSMATRVFIELFVGSTICQSLYNLVFRPFYPTDPAHPGAATQMKALTAVYKELRLRGECARASGYMRPFF